MCIGLIILSGVAIVSTDIWREYTDASNFIPIIVVVGMLIAYEFVVNLKIAPKLLDLHFVHPPGIYTDRIFSSLFGFTIASTFSRTVSV